MKRQTWRQWPISLAFLAVTGAAAGAATDAPGLAIRPSGPAQTVYSWQSMRCEDWDIPDAPARAWRDRDGRVHLIASHVANRAMTGPDLDHIRPDCRVVYRGGEESAPERYDDRSWIASPYTLEGETVFALVHNEFHGHLRPALCASREYERCWANAVTEIVSHDGGLSFAHAPAPRHLVAALPYRYAGDVGRRTGYFTPSNIVARGGFHYAFFWAEAQGAQKRGACLMRTADLADPRAWRGWDGGDFTVQFADPYVATDITPAKHVCTPVGDGRLVATVASVTLHRGSGLYVALMATSRPVKPGEQPATGVFASTSPDLLHWSEPALVMKAAVQFKLDCGDAHAISYPSLLDPAAATRNFEDTGDIAYLYMTDFHLRDCRLNQNRDLVRVLVTLGPPAHQG